MNKLVDKLLDKVWDVVEPVAGTCPVCAFFRGALAMGIVCSIIALACSL